MTSRSQDFLISRKRWTREVESGPPDQATSTRSPGARRRCLLIVLRNVCRTRPERLGGGMGQSLAILYSRFALNKNRKAIPIASHAGHGHAPQAAPSPEIWGSGMKPAVRVEKGSNPF